MGTTSQKLTYLNDTKTKIRDGINAIGGSLDSDDTFRSYADELKSLYNDMPKVSASDVESASLSPTRKGAMSITYKGDTKQDSEPTPSSPQPIHNVSGDNTIEICGKNRLDLDNLTKMYSSNTNASVIETGLRATAISTANNMMIVFYIGKASNLVGKTIRMKTKMTPSASNKGRYYLGYCDNDGGNRVSIDTATNSETTITMVVDNAHQENVIFTIYSNASGTASSGDYVDYTNMIITIDDEDMTYEAYTGNSQLISLGNIELNKISTYQDYIYKDNDRWFLHKEIGKVVLDGSESWVMPSVGTYFRYDNNTFKPSGDGSIVALGYSNLFKASSYNDIYNGTPDYAFGFATSSNRIAIRNKDISSANDFQTWLSTHNTIVCYALNEATDTEITNTTLLEQLETIKRSYDGVTNISQENNDLPFILDVSALKEWNNE